MASEIKKSYVPRTEYLGLPGDERMVQMPPGCRSVLFVFDDMVDAERFNRAREPVMVFESIPAPKGTLLDGRGRVTKVGEPVEGVG